MVWVIFEMCDCVFNVEFVMFEVDEMVGLFVIVVDKVNGDVVYVVVVVFGG